MTTGSNKRRLAKQRLILAAIVAVILGAHYLATHTHAEVNRSYGWISIDAGHGAYTVYAERHGVHGGVIATRYDHWDTTVTPLVSVAAYNGRNAGVAVGTPGGWCAGYEVVGKLGLWISRTDC